MLRDANVVVPAAGCGFLEISKFQEYYARRGIAIVVYDRETFGSGEPPFFDGHRMISVDNPTVINLYHDEKNRHFDTILNLVGAAQSKFFCIYCNKRYHYVDQHTCTSVCACCFVTPACKTEGAVVKCQDCMRNFLSERCFTNHKTEGSYKTKNKKICNLIKMCTVCHKVFHIHRGKHECGVFYCKYCRMRHSRNSLCFMKPTVSSTRAKDKKYLYVFYDLETRQEDTYKNHPTTLEHVPNLCIAQQVCSDCLLNDAMTQRCNTCGTREHIFKQNPVTEFLDLYLRQKSIFEKIICIAHNASGFDAQFILREIVETRKDVVPKLILNGRNIIMLQYGRTTFIDSLNYFHMKLSALPKAFGLPPSAKKGYFPHLFNTVEHANYIGPLPAARYYVPDSMSDQERRDFYEWYDKTALEYVFDFKKEIVDYCRMDVEILRRACMAFRKIFLDVGKVCPFTEATTIASACSLVYRKNFLKPKTIGIMPPRGYRRSDNHSQKSIEWLLQCEREFGREIIHAGRAHEYRLPEGFLVDGFLPPPPLDDLNEKGIVFEFEGCYVHGCPKCFVQNRNKRLVFGNTFNEAYENTLAKLEKIHECGYEVRYMWECDFNKVKRENPEIAQYVKNHPIMSRVTLNPRDAFFGGRTENIIPFYKVKDGEKIKYTDICSLYPYVCKRGKFSIGHPRVYMGSECNELTCGDDNNLSRVEGLVKCKILPPRDLYLPLLPVKMNGRLLFALCRSCCEEARENDCNHEEIGDREFMGTWVADELRKAVDLGYRVTSIYIIWQYKTTRFDGESGGLFTDYVNTFLKIKQEASGWPEWCTDEESKSRYLNKYKQDEGIALEREKVVKNSGLRAVAKLCLNSLWGKFGQRSNLKQTEVVKTRETLLNLLTCPDKEVLSILPVNDETLYVNWQYREEAVTSSPNTSVVIAAYTTAQARLELYRHMEKLGRRLLYCDTDSCIFVKDENKPDEYEPPLGNLLGEMTDELESYGEGTYIDTMVSAAPKFYAYRAITPTGTIVECCKVKGISLNFKNSLKINFDSINALIVDNFDNKEVSCDKEAIRINFKSIKRTCTHEIVTRDEMKTCTAVLKKRRYISAGQSLPFGYKCN